MVCRRTVKNSGKILNEINNIKNKKYISIVSAWEVAIKLGTKKLTLDGGLPEFFKIIDKNGFILLTIEKNDLKSVPDLRLIHRDPFDRLLISTAIAKKFIIITADENIQKYDVSWIW